MTNKTVLSDEQIGKALHDAGILDLECVALRYDLDIARATEQAVLQSPEVQAWKRDAELGQCAMMFVDRAGDYCKEDPAERICDQFHAAMADIVDRHGAMRGMPSGKYKINGDLK